MLVSREQLVRDLLCLGLSGGDNIMLHASIRAVGRVHGGPDQIHLAVEQAISPSGTLLMYVGCQHGFDDVGRGWLSKAEEAAILEHQPAFSFRHARASRDFGVLAEFFRSSPGTVCSDHVARIAARGMRAEWFIAGQPWNYPYGVGSPLHKLCQAGGKVLLLGSDHDEVTLLHHAEHIAQFDGKRIARYKVPLEREGRRVWVDCEEFDTSGKGVHANWPGKFFEIIVDGFIMAYSGSQICREGQVGNAHCVLMDAAALVNHAVPLMEARAKGQPEPIA
jgi:aminoglycoside 3-N-acetyltransferase